VEAEYEERRKDAPASSNCGLRHRGRGRSSFNGVCASPARSRKCGHNDIPASSPQRRRKGKANSDPYALRCTRASLTVNSHTKRMDGRSLLYESEKQQRSRSPTFSNPTLRLPPMAPQKPIKAAPIPSVRSGGSAGPCPRPVGAVPCEVRWNDFRM
jgi:hypothetical protein